MRAALWSVADGPTGLRRHQDGHPGCHGRPPDLFQLSVKVAAKALLQPTGHRYVAPLLWGDVTLLKIGHHPTPPGEGGAAPRWTGPKFFRLVIVSFLLHPLVQLASDLGLSVSIDVVKPLPLIRCLALVIDHSPATPIRNPSARIWPLAEGQNEWRPSLKPAKEAAVRRRTRD